MRKRKKKKEAEGKRRNEEVQRAQSYRDVLRVRGKMPAVSGTVSFNNSVSEKRRKELGKTGQMIHKSGNKRQKGAPISSSHSTDAMAKILPALEARRVRTKRISQREAGQMRETLMQQLALVDSVLEASEEVQEVEE